MLKADRDKSLLGGQLQLVFFMGSGKFYFFWTLQIRASSSSSSSSFSSSSCTTEIMEKEEVIHAIPAS